MTGRAISASALWFIFAAALADVAPAQRTVEKHSLSEPEGKLMGFYSSAFAYSPVAPPSM